MQNAILADCYGFVEFVSLPFLRVSSQITNVPEYDFAEQFWARDVLHRKTQQCHV